MSIRNLMDECDSQHTIVVFLCKAWIDNNHARALGQIRTLENLSSATKSDITKDIFAATITQVRR